MTAERDGTAGSERGDPHHEAASVSLRAILDRAEQRRQTLVVFAPERDRDLVDRFATRNVDVVYRDLPADGTEPFAVVRGGTEFGAAVSLADLRSFLEPPVTRPDDLDHVDPATRSVVRLFEDAVFASLDRRQLLATCRELEDRAMRTGRGELRVGFQRRDAFTAQERLYRRFASDTDLRVHVHLPDDERPSLASERAITFHDGPADEVGRFWFFAFDGGGDDERACALVAEERDPDTYYGVWTYDPAVVDEVFDAVT